MSRFSLLRGLRRSKAAVPSPPKRKINLFPPVQALLILSFLFPPFSLCFMNSSGWTTRPHLALRPPPPFNMSFPPHPTPSFPGDCSISPFLISYLTFPLCTYLNLPPFPSLLPSIRSIPVPTPRALPLTFSSLASLFSSIYVFPPCFLDRMVATEYKINMAVTFWALIPGSTPGLFSSDRRGSMMCGKTPLIRIWMGEWRRLRGCN